MTALLAFVAAAGPLWAPADPILDGAVDPAPDGPRLILPIEGKSDLEIRLFEREAPRTVAHILGLAQRGFYDQQRFFRVVRQPRPFAAYFGDPASKTASMSDPSLGTGGTGTRLPYEETGRRHTVGAVGLSRLPDDRDSGDCQFYIVLGPAAFLDGSYTVFGQVVSNLELLNRLEEGDRVGKVRIARP